MCLTQGSENALLNIFLNVHPCFMNYKIMDPLFICFTLP